MTPTAARTAKRVCVIGSGPTGLTAIKQLKDEGHDVVCYDRGKAVGGIWSQENAGEQGQWMAVYDSLVLTVSMRLMSFSDYMVEPGRVYYTHRQYRRYLEAYAERFGLYAHIQHDAEVQHVERNEDGSWTVRAIVEGEERSDRFDAIALCTGPFQSPNKDVRGLEHFTGEVVHTQEYRSPERFRGKRVLVVGLAESGADVLREISEVAESCTLGIQSYTYLLPRLFDGKWSTDHATTRADHWEMYVRSTGHAFPMLSVFGDTKRERRLFAAAARVLGTAAALEHKAKALLRKEEPEPELNRMGEPFYPLKLDIGCEFSEDNVNAIMEWNRRSHHFNSSYAKRKILCKNVSFIPNLVNGKIQLNDSGIASMKGQDVHFNNGEWGQYDAIVLCTGFKLENGQLGADTAVPGGNVRNLYKHMINPRHEGTLAHLGYIRPLSGGNPVVAEMQARYFAQICSGKVALPDDVHRRIEEEKGWETRFTCYSPKANNATPSQAFYMDALAREIGCVMTAKELLKNPKLLVRHWFYPLNQACYRLVGPHATPEAMEEFESDSAEGPVAGPETILKLIKLSLMPPGMHPENLGAPKPPKGSTSYGTTHFPPKPRTAPLTRVDSAPNRVAERPMGTVTSLRP